MVDVGGIRKKAWLDLLSEVQVGDYVIVHAGYAIQKVDAQDAEETLRLLREMVSTMPFEEEAATMTEEKGSR
jgi:hydrogenase expression/formation protein HypC